MDDDTAEQPTRGTRTVVACEFYARTLDPRRSRRDRRAEFETLAEDVKEVYRALERDSRLKADAHNAKVRAARVPAGAAIAGSAGAAAPQPARPAASPAVAKARLPTPVQKEVAGALEGLLSAVVTGASRAADASDGIDRGMATREASWFCDKNGLPAPTPDQISTLTDGVDGALHAALEQTACWIAYHNKESGNASRFRFFLVERLNFSDASIAARSGLRQYLVRLIALGSYADCYRAAPRAVSVDGDPFAAPASTPAQRLVNANTSGATLYRCKRFVTNSARVYSYDDKSKLLSLYARMTTAAGSSRDDLAMVDALSSARGKPLERISAELGDFGVRLREACSTFCGRARMGTISLIDLGNWLRCDAGAARVLRPLWHSAVVAAGVERPNVLHSTTALYLFFDEYIKSFGNSVTKHVVDQARRAEQAKVSAKSAKKAAAVAKKQPGKAVEPRDSSADEDSADSDSSAEIATERRPAKQPRAISAFGAKSLRAQVGRSFAVASLFNS